MSGLNKECHFGMREGNDALRPCKNLREKIKSELELAKKLSLFLSSR